MFNIGKSFFGKKILITGHTGFKGSWLSIWLKELGAEVIGYSLNPYTERDNFVLSGLENRITSIIGDIRDYDTLFSIFETYKPEVVFHLAAQPLVRYSYEFPKQTYDINVGGTVNILECIRNSKYTKVGIIITSDKCYQNNEWVWGYRENDRLGGKDPYSSSKGASEIVISGYINSFFNENSSEKLIASVRAGNVIGGGDWSSDRLVPDSIRALEAEKQILLRNPNSTRPWQFVLEPLYGYLMIAHKLIEGRSDLSGSWNFGPDNNSIISVEELTKQIIEIWGSGSYKYANKNDNKNESKNLSLDCSKAKSLLEWKPILDIKKSLEYTIDWYKNYANNDTYNICAKQIKEYSEGL